MPTASRQLSGKKSLARQSWIIVFFLLFYQNQFWIFQIDEKLGTLLSYSAFGVHFTSRKGGFINLQKCIQQYFISVRERLGDVPQDSLAGKALLSQLIS